MQNENRLLSPIALLFVIAAHALLYWLLTSIKPPQLPPEPPGLSFVDLGEIGGGGGGGGASTRVTMMLRSFSAAAFGATAGIRSIIRAAR